MERRRGLPAAFPDGFSAEAQEHQRREEDDVDQGEDEPSVFEANLIRQREAAKARYQYQVAQDVELGPRASGLVKTYA